MHLGVITALTSLNGGQPNFARCDCRLLGGTLRILGLLPANGILLGAMFTLRPSHAFSYIGSVTAIEQWELAKLCGVGQGRELRNFRFSFAPPIGLFGRAAITLGIGPHSSFY